jgi:hypothetical protein
MAVRLSALQAGRLLPPGRFLVLISVRGWVDPRAIVWLEGLGQLKNPLTSSGIEPATFQLVAWCHNQLRYCVPPRSMYYASKLRVADLKSLPFKLYISSVSLWQIFDCCPVDYLIQLQQNNVTFTSYRQASHYWCGWCIFW